MTFDQSGYRCRFEWGRQGAKNAAKRGDILVIVDVLRFSSTVVTALHYGATLFPCETKEERDAIVAQNNLSNEYSLSPRSVSGIEAGTRIALASLNGAICTKYGSEAPYLFVGALLNAEAVGVAVSKLLLETPYNVTVVACGERWTSQNCDGELRFAIEDYLGAGAILSYLSFSKSPEARLCESSFVQAKQELEFLISECGSGRELCERGRCEDVFHVVQLNSYSVVPTLKAGWFVPYESV